MLLNLKLFSKTRIQIRILYIDGPSVTCLHHRLICMLAQHTAIGSALISLTNHSSPRFSTENFSSFIKVYILNVTSMLNTNF